MNDPKSIEEQMLNSLPPEQRSQFEAMWEQHKRDPLPWLKKMYFDLGRKIERIEKEQNARKRDR